jgi:hypothetical protein
MTTIAVEAVVSQQLILFLEALKVICFSIEGMKIFKVNYKICNVKKEKEKENKNKKCEKR